MNIAIRSHKKTIIFLIGVLILLAALTYFYVGKYGSLAGLQNDLKSIEPETEFSYTDLNGNIINLNDFKGKPLVVNSWASWVPFSQTELPLFILFADKYQDKINFLAINRKEPVGVVKSFLATYNIPESSLFLLDPSDNFYKVVGGYAVPETVFYDADGVLVSHKRGSLTEVQLQTLIDTLLSTQK